MTKKSKLFTPSSVYFLGLVLLAIGLPLSKFLMSVAQFILIINWLFNGNIINNFQKFFKNKPAVIFCSIFLIHVLGLLYTSDFSYALKDLRTKLPILLIPLVIATTKPLEQKKFFQIIIIFIGAVLAGTVAGLYKTLFTHITDARDISPFISHIRFSLNICLAIFSLLYFLVINNKFIKKSSYKIAAIIIMLWMIVFLFILSSLTGIFVLIITSIAIALYFIFTIKSLQTYIRFLLMGSIVLIPLFSFLYVNHTVHDYYDVPDIAFNKLEMETAQGNLYVHDTIHQQIENGNYLWLYVCPDELQEAWGTRSRYPLDGLDRKGQGIKYTLIRFLNSKGFHKDAEGVNNLTKEEVQYIEDGVANYQYTKKFNPKSRIYQVLWEFDNYQFTGDPGGLSLLQRMEYWKTSWAIIKSHFFFGVGTGDLNLVFKQQYEKMKSPLLPKWQHRSHNQFLSIFIAFGMVGFCWFIYALFYPAIKTHSFNDYFFFVFFVILFLSMLAEDTIESQAGVSFFAFFYALFVFGREKKKEKK